MRAALDRPGIEHVALMREHLGFDGERDTGGKMLRPALCLLACEAVGALMERALAAAAAIELLHNFTLIHDDIEDASDTRHGRETLWRRHGIPLAINAGDGMFVLAQRTLLDLEQTGVPPDRILAAARVLDEACVILCEGQHLDLSFESRHRVSLAEYEAMIAGKTAALLGASVEIGAMAGGADDITSRALGECGRMLGMAFQVHDDVLGVWGDESQTGKPVADDIRSRKKSFPIVWAFEQAPRRAREELDRIYTGEMDEPAVNRAVALLEESGARAAATDTAERWLDDALSQLNGLDLVGARRGDIEALARFFVERSV
jgi:geranylgeranyl diphosphate synthase type I